MDKIKGGLHLLSAGGSAPPSSFKVFPLGHYRYKHLGGSEQSVEVDAESCAAIMDCYSKRGHKIPIDYNHASMVDGATAQQGKSAGWLELESRDDGIWAINASWTPEATAMLEAREYAFWSPVFAKDAKKRPVELHNIALTNTPATLNQAPLVALSAAAQPTDGEILDPLLDKRVIAILTSAGKPTLEEIPTVIEQLKAVASQAASLKVEVEALKAAKTTAEKQTIIASNSAKISPAMQPAMLALDIEALKSLVAVLPTLIAAPVNQPNTVAPTSLSAAALASGKNWAALSAAEKEDLFKNAPEQFKRLLDEDRRTSGVWATV